MAGVDYALCTCFTAPKVDGHEMASHLAQPSPDIVLAPNTQLPLVVRTPTDDSVVAAKGASVCPPRHDFQSVQPCRGTIELVRMGGARLLITRCQIFLHLMCTLNTTRCKVMCRINATVADYLGQGQPLPNSHPCA